MSRADWERKLVHVTLEVIPWEDTGSKRAGANPGAAVYGAFSAIGTCRIWSPSRTPWLSARLPSCTFDTKMPTSFPPVSRSPKLLAFTNRTTLELVLYLPQGSTVSSVVTRKDRIGRR